jgi:hypothetical protein
VGTKFAHFSIYGTNETETINLLAGISQNKVSIYDRLNKVNPNVAEKLEKAMKELSTIQPDNPRTEKLGGYNVDNVKSALEYLHSTRTEYYIAKNNKWITIHSEEFGFENIDDIALKISKNTPQFIMANANFDDDVFILSLLKNGGTITRHISGDAELYGMEKTVGNIKAISDTLNLEGKEDELELFLNEDDIWQKFQSLEKLLNMKLWLPRRMITQNQDNGLIWKKFYL